MRIVIAEDEQMFREVLHKVCAEQFGHEIVGEAGSGDEAIRIVAATRPDLLLLDLDLPEVDGFAVVEAVKRLSRSTRVVAVTSSRATYTLFRIERSGFDGYIDKGANSLVELRQAVAAAAEGRCYHSPTFVTVKQARLRDPKAFDKVLSNREQEVLSLIGWSMNDREIGERLGICAKTVETFRHRILQKLDVRGTPKLIRFAIETGFTQVPLAETRSPFSRVAALAS